MTRAIVLFVYSLFKNKFIFKKFLRKSYQKVVGVSLHLRLQHRGGRAKRYSF
jgi:hypothetical protein